MMSFSRRLFAVVLAVVLGGMSSSAVARAAGTTQSLVPTSGGRDSALLAVSADSTSDAWAVGNSENSSGAYRTLTWHWNGVLWTRVASPDPGGTTTPGQVNELTAVAAVSRDDAWAVGFYARGLSDSAHGLILHWDGSSWTTVASPCTDAVTCFLYGVSFDSPTDAWAVGETSGKRAASLALHWDGRSWTRVASPEPAILHGVSVDSPTDAWAVGYWEKTATEALVTVALHWNGAAWTRVPSPNPSGTTFPAVNRLHGVSANGTADAWAVGDRRLKSSNYAVTFLRWNGVSWNSA